MTAHNWDNFKPLPITGMVASPSEFLSEIWEQGIKLRPGEQVEAPFKSREDANKAQRWLFRERKRQKAWLIRQNATAEVRMDPDDADMWRGLTTSLKGNSLIVRRPEGPKALILTRADGTTKKIALASKGQR